MHSLKGSAFLFSYNNLGQVAHAMESSLERVRNGTHAHSPELLNGLFKSLTLMEGLVSKIKTNEPIEEIVQKIPEVIRAMNEAAEKLKPAAETEEPPKAVAVAAATPAAALAKKPRRANDRGFSVVASVVWGSMRLVLGFILFP